MNTNTYMCTCIILITVIQGTRLIVLESVAKNNSPSQDEESNRESNIESDSENIKSGTESIFENNMEEGMTNKFCAD